MVSSLTVEQGLPLHHEVHQPPQHLHCHLQAMSDKVKADPHDHPEAHTDPAFALSPLGKEEPRLVHKMSAAQHLHYHLQIKRPVPRNGTHVCIGSCSICTGTCRPREMHAP